MKWTEITIWTSHEASEAVSELLMRLGAAGVSVEDPDDLLRPRENPFGEWYEITSDLMPFADVRVKGYFSELLNQQSLLQDIKEELSTFQEYGLDPGKAEIESKEVDEEDWATAWKQFFKPVRVTERLTIKPTWEPYMAAPPDEIVIELDPGMAFGTGTHPTTALCMRILEKWLAAGARVVDVGTGSAILAIACAKMGAKSVLALDLDPVAVKVAQDNVRQNGVEQQVTVQTNDLLKGIAGPFSVVVANILADIIDRMIPDASRVLESGGIFIASGIIQEKSDWIQSELQTHGFAIQHVEIDQDWAAIVATKA